MNASLTKNNQMQKTLVLHYSGSVTDRKVSNTHTHTHTDKFEHKKPVLIKKKKKTK